MKRTVRTFLQSRRAVIAVEFAIFLPIMLVLWLGLFEYGSAHLAAKKVESAAQSVADLIAQETTVDLAALGDFPNAINAIIDPFPTGSIGYQIISVESDASDNTSVAWYYPTGGSAPAVPAEAEPLVIGNDSVIVVTVTYSHVPWLARYFVASGDIPISETAYARPRLISSVACTDCP